MLCRAPAPGLHTPGTVGSEANLLLLHHDLAIGKSTPVAFQGCL